MSVNRHEVLRAVGDVFGLSLDQLLGVSRKPRLSKARQIAAYFLRERAELSLPKAGAALGGRHHATILHAVRCVSNKPERYEPELSSIAARLQ